MVYLSSTLIALVLFLAEVSLLSHFLPWITLPVLVLPFLVIVSMKDRTIYPIFLAGTLGLLTDSVSGGNLHIYLATYLGIVLISKVFLNRFLSYGEFRANLINLAFGVFVIYGADIALKLSVLGGWFWILPIMLNVFVVVVILSLYTLFGQRYFCWLEKETEERFR